MTHRLISAHAIRRRFTPLLSVALLTGGALAISAGVITPASADVRAGVTAWESGDYTRAVAEWRPLAIAGDPDAQFNLGQAYKLGRGVEQDLNQAAQWYRRAADQNHLQSQDNLGLVLYELGQRAEALPYLDQSASRGEPRAQFVLGAELFNGERISRDLPRAYALMKRASDAGLQRASAALAQMDQNISLEQRQQGLALAASMEASEAQARLAAMSTAATPRPRPAATVRPTAVPPSQPGVSYTPPPVDVAVTATAPTAPSIVPAVPAPTGTQRTPTRQPPVIVRESAIGVASAPAATSAAPAPAAAQVPTRARPAATAGGNWRVQLGAFSNRGNAQALWSRLSARLNGAEPVYTSAGNVVRLQAGPYASRAAAEAACAAVRPQACFAVSR